MAPTIDRTKVDVRQPAWSSWRARGDPAAFRPPGGGETPGGVHARPRGGGEGGAWGRAVDDRADAESGGRAAGAGAADLVADVSAGTLGPIAGADFFTTDVWTWRGLVTYDTVFVIDLASLVVC